MDRREASRNNARKAAAVTNFIKRLKKEYNLSHEDARRITKKRGTSFVEVIQVNPERRICFVGLTEEESLEAEKQFSEYLSIDIPDRVEIPDDILSKSGDCIAFIHAD